MELSKKRSEYTEYSSWSAMKDRCYNPKNKNYLLYGGRGITVCDRWVGTKYKEGFKNFINDMGEKPDSNYTIDRIDNNAGYSPDNCRWATKTEQIRNRSISIKISYNGKTQSIKEWSIETGINADTIHHRYREGLTTYAILSPVKANGRNRKDNRYIEYKGERKILRDWCNELDLHYYAMKNRIFCKNWTVSKAFETPLMKKYKKVQK